MKKLKKTQIFTIVTCGLAAVLLTMVLAVGLNTDHFGFGPNGKPPAPLRTPRLWTPRRRT